MGSCLSLCFPSEKPPQQQSQQSPLSYAAAVAQTAVHTVSELIQQPQHAVPTGAEGKQVIRGAYVFKMPDGDTFNCDYTDGSGEKATARVRVMAIDCPETKQNFGQQATQIGQQMLLRTNVTLYVHTTDRYGRLVADVITKDGVNYGEYMLEQGAAWHYKAYDKRQHLAHIEEEAKNANIGLWSFARPLEPWEYRRRKRNNNKK
ncbi:unnamed protein product [Agarophyton chilense]